MSTWCQYSPIRILNKAMTQYRITLLLIFFNCPHVLCVSLQYKHKLNKTVRRVHMQLVSVSWYRHAFYQYRYPILVSVHPKKKGDTWGQEEGAKVSAAELVTSCLRCTIGGLAVVALTSHPPSPPLGSQVTHIAANTVSLAHIRASSNWQCPPTHGTRR